MRCIKCGIKMNKPVRFIHIPFDVDLHRQMRMQAMNEDKNLREFLEQCVSFYLKSIESERTPRPD